MFLQKANPNHGKDGRFTTGGGSVRIVPPSAASHGSVYKPAKESILNGDGSLNMAMAKQIANHPDVAKGWKNAKEFRNSGPTTEDFEIVAVREMQGFNGKPGLVEPAEFEYLGGQTFFRGDSKAEHSEHIKNGTFRGGRGINGNGTYASDRSREAAGFAGKHRGGYGQPEWGGMIAFKMHENSRTAIFDKGRGMQINRQKVLDQITLQGANEKLTSDEDIHLRHFFSDDGRLAAGLGFDAFMATEHHIVVLNRTAMIISDRSVDPSLLGVDVT